ncbi:MAG: hypothetical protein DRN14_02570 [Thermoplasmata archaeon]|nr:MAG: hypothetical protein DRN14_02570 [Thermoplasmata archaeon]
MGKIIALMLATIPIYYAIVSKNSFIIKLVIVLVVVLLVAYIFYRKLKDYEIFVNLEENLS